MHVHILGSAAGGGFPQWNCNCRNCAGFRAGTVRASARTQSSVALSDNGAQWILCNASPDIRAQLAAFPALHPQQLRENRIKAIVLLDAQIDHVTGLLSLREGCPHPLYCTEAVHSDLSTAFPLFPMLLHWNGGLQHCPIELFTPWQIPACPDLRLTALPLESNAPPYSPRRGHPQAGDNIGLYVEDLRSGQSLFYAPGLGRVDSALLEILREADCLLLDGTLWRDDELRVQGVGQLLGTEMGHLPQSGAGGMLEVLQGLSARKILIHINNTNPILDEDSPERAQLTAQGVEIAFDGMRIVL